MAVQLLRVAQMLYSRHKSSDHILDLPQLSVFMDKGRSQALDAVFKVGTYHCGVHKNIYLWGERSESVPDESKHPPAICYSCVYLE